MFCDVARVLYCIPMFSAIVAGQSVTLTGNCPAPADGARELVCTYTVDLAGLSVGDRLSVGLQIPTAVDVWRSPDLGCSDGQCEAALKAITPRVSHIEYTFSLSATDGTIKFSVAAPRSDYISETKSYYVERNGQEITPKAGTRPPVPHKRAKASLVRPVIGGGFTRLRDDFVDFKEVKETDERIFTDNDSKLRAQVLGGALFKVYESEGGRTEILSNVVDGRGSGGVVLNDQSILEFLSF